MQKRIFDFGMYDASDTIYYLEEGFSVVAVEANPVLVQRARSVLSRYIREGKLDVVHAAIGIDNNDVELTVCGDDLGSSSVIADSVAERTPIGKYTVPGITTDQLIERYGVPYYLKIDIEGADHLCVKSLSDQRRPEYLSFEINGSLDEMVGHLTSIGYSQFKLINQINFREISNEGNVRDRFARKIVRTLGYAEPQYRKRHGRYFKIGHSSGPAPWQSDGKWFPQDEVLRSWRAAQRDMRAGVWYDLHASRV
jgi:FkbM family methyltransferase